MAMTCALLYCSEANRLTNQQGNAQTSKQLHARTNKPRDNNTL